MLESSIKVPRVLLLERDGLSIILDHLIKLAIKKASTDGISIFVCWKPPESSESSPKNNSDELTVDRVYVVNGKSVDSNFSQLSRQINNLRINQNETQAEKSEIGTQVTPARNYVNGEYSPLLKNELLMPY
jgi:hypothetical protein